MYMKAIQRTRYGAPEVLTIKDVSRPEPKENEVLVKVHATTINRTDCGILTGKPFAIRFFTGLFKPRDMVPGTDYAGEVVAVGEAVTAFEPGQRVWGFYDEGISSQAQYLCIDAKSYIVKIPDHVSDHEAVASGEGAHYALNFLNKTDLPSEHRVLLNGATGAIGSAALQLLKENGNFVTAVCNTKNIALINALGADRVYNYEKEDFTKDDLKYDLVFDAVGKSSFGKCKAIMQERSIYISSELGPGNENLYLPFSTIFSKQSVKFAIPTNCKRSIKQMTERLNKGTFKPVIDRIYHMHEIQEAYRYVASGQKTGNVILHISHDT